jgi:hypothetical protein
MDLARRLPVSQKFLKKPTKPTYFKQIELVMPKAKIHPKFVNAAQ